MHTLEKNLLKNIKIGFLDERKLPFLIEAEKTGESFAYLTEITAAEKVFFNRQLLRYGALLFRNFAVESVEQFGNFARAFSGGNFFSYAGGVSPRISLNKGIYSSTEYPPDLKLSLHNELSYSENYPRQLYFHCQIAPEIGGETALGDSRRILKNIDAPIVEKFRNKKIRYERCLYGDASSEYSWQAAFETNDKLKIEQICRSSGANFRWEKNDSLIISQTRPATVVHPETGEEVWFNQAEGFHPSALDSATYNYFVSNELNFRLNSFFGDSEPLEVESLDRIRQVSEAETVPVRWQKGDVLIVDNLLTAHGRLPFSGARKIALAMI